MKLNKWSEFFKSSAYVVVSYPLILFVCSFIAIEAFFVVIPNINVIILSSYMSMFLTADLADKGLVRFLAQYAVVIVFDAFLGYGIWKLILLVAGTINSFMKKHLRFGMGKD